jgi:hypothetical protein
MTDTTDTRTFQIEALRPVHPVSKGPSRQVEAWLPVGTIDIAADTGFPRDALVAWVDEQDSRDLEHQLGRYRVVDQRDWGATVTEFVLHEQRELVIERVERPQLVADVEVLSEAALRPADA